MPGSNDAQERSHQLQELELAVMRYADEYAGRTKEALNQFQAQASTPEERLAAQNWKVQQSDAAYTIASGPNAVSNALDMVVLATLSRMVIDDVWLKNTYGNRSLLLRDTHRSLEAGAWQLVDGILTDSQKARLHEIITLWRTQHPEVRAVAYIHFRDFAKSVGAPQEGEETTSGNLFSALGIDPFADLDPAVREITQTRELAERSIFYAQRAPSLLDMQIERLTYQFAVMPETKSMLSSVERVSLVGSASDRLVTTFPQILDHERAALIAQLNAELNNSRATVDSVTGELRTTLQAGTEAATAVNAMLETADRIAARLATQPHTATPAQPGPPFDIREYTAMLREAGLTARQLDALMQRTDVLMPAMQRASDDAADSARRVLNHLFLLMGILVAATITLTLLAAHAYRRTHPHPTMSHR